VIAGMAPAVPAAAPNAAIAQTSVSRVMAVRALGVPSRRIEILVSGPGRSMPRTTAQTRRDFRRPPRPQARFTVILKDDSPTAAARITRSALDLVDPDHAAHHVRLDVAVV